MKALFLTTKSRTSHLLAGVFALSGPSVLAGEAPVMVQGLFCNSEQALDAVLAQIGRGLNPKLATETANTSRVECTFADLLRYQVSGAWQLAPSGGDPEWTRFQAMLVGVMAGDRLLPVEPPAPVYFVSPQLTALPAAGFPV